MKHPRNEMNGTLIRETWNVIRSDKNEIQSEKTKRKVCGEAAHNEAAPIIEMNRIVFK